MNDPYQEFLRYWYCEKCCRRIDTPRISVDTQIRLRCRCGHVIKHTPSERDLDIAIRRWVFAKCIKRPVHRSIAA